MSEGKTPQLSRLPFWFADAMLLLTAGLLVMSSGRALGLWEMLAIVGCVALGGWLAVLPVLKEYDVAVKWAETDQLATTVAKLKDVDLLAEQPAANQRPVERVESLPGALRSPTDAACGLHSVRVRQLRRDRTQGCRRVGQQARSVGSVPVPPHRLARAAAAASRGLGNLRRRVRPRSLRVRRSRVD